MAQKIAKYLGNLCKKSWLQELLKNAKSGHTGYIVRSKTTIVVVSGRASRQLDKRLLVVVVGPIIVIIISRWLPIIECGTTYCLPMAYPDHKHPQVFKCFKCYGLTEGKDPRVGNKCRECQGTSFVSDLHPLVAIL